MKEPRRTLKKNSISMLEGILFVIGATIGSGIFLKPAIVLNCTGSTAGALSMWIFGGLITLCAALSIAEIAAYIPKVGGLYAYLTELYGPGSRISLRVGGSRHFQPRLSPPRSASPLRHLPPILFPWTGWKSS